MASLFSKYSQLLQKYPLRTKMITAMIISGTGDTLCQRFVEKHEQSYARTTKVASYGFCIVAPSLHFWYKLLDKLFPAQSYQGKPKWQQLALRSRKILVDQLVFAPAIIVVFFIYMGTVTHLQHNGITNFDVRKLHIEIKNKMKEEYVNAVKMNYTIWPIAQVFNFNLVPPQYQVLFANHVSLLWTTYLSYIQHKKLQANSAVVHAVEKEKVGL